MYTEIYRVRLKMLSKDVLSSIGVSTSFALELFLLQFDRKNWQIWSLEFPSIKRKRLEKVRYEIHIMNRYKPHEWQDGEFWGCFFGRIVVCKSCSKMAFLSEKRKKWNLLRTNKRAAGGYQMPSRIKTEMGHRLTVWTLSWFLKSVLLWNVLLQWSHLNWPEFCEENEWLWRIRFNWIDSSHCTRHQPRETQSHDCF